MLIQNLKEAERFIMKADLTLGSGWSMDRLRVPVRSTALMKNKYLAIKHYQIPLINENDTLDIF